MTSLRMTGLASLSLLIGLIIVAVAFNWSGNQSVSAAQLLLEGEDIKQDLIDGTLEGRLLYIQSKDYVLGRVGPSEYPDQVVLETWLGANDEGLISTAVSAMSAVDGTVIQHSRLIGNRVIVTDVATGQTFEHRASGSGTLESWLNDVWQRPENMTGEGVTDKGEGTYKGMRSRVYERSVNTPERFSSQDSGALLERIEIVEDAPLFLQQSIIRETPSGERVSLKSNGLSEYELLPEGSTPPNF